MQNTVPTNIFLDGGTLPPNNILDGGTVPPNNFFDGGTVPSNNLFGGGTVPPLKRKVEFCPFLISRQHQNLKNNHNIFDISRFSFQTSLNLDVIRKLKANFGWKLHPGHILMVNLLN